MTTNIEDIYWVIERWFNSDLRYWVGSHTDDRGFLPEHEKAIRFYREVDAAQVLAWILGGHGRVCEHVLVTPPGEKPARVVPKRHEVTYPKDNV